MRRVFLGFVLGVSSSVAATPLVQSLDASPQHVAPNGKAEVTEWGRGENAWFGLLTLEADASVPEHQDPTEEYIHVLEGSGTLTMDGVTYSLGPGHSVVMPSGATVRYENGPKTFIAVQVFAGPESADKYAAWPVREPSTPR